MSKEEIKEEQINNTPQAEEVQAIKTSEFMKETIKQRPINKKKLVRKLFITVTTAVVFGLVACLTFLFLEPIISERLNPEEEVEQVTFVEETIEEETKPEDMIADESELMPAPKEAPVMDDTQLEEILSGITLDVDDYLALNNVVTDMASEVSGSIVKVIGITQDVDWFDNEYSSENIVSGVVVADNGRDFLILANIKPLKDLDKLEVKFAKGDAKASEILAKDSVTGLAIIAVKKSILSISLIDSVKIIEMGSSVYKNLSGTPVVALGRPQGTDQSIGIGYVTSSTGVLNLPDAAYRGLSTDIIGKDGASGILVNMNGQLIGIIDQTYNPSDMKNLISGIGISDIKKLIEKLSNGKEIPYLGLYGVDVTPEIGTKMNIPIGVYIKSMEMDSPLFESGVQNGDIIVKFAGADIVTFMEINNLLLSLSPEEKQKITVMRQGPDGYTPLELEVVLAHQK